MPPKKGKDKPAKKKEKEKEDLGPPVPTEKELQLQTELDELQEKLTILKSEVESLRKENDFLNEEAGQTRTESHEYMSFMAKKTNKRQTAIISLSDKNENELQKISAEKKEMLKQYEERKEDLKEMLLEKEHYLAKANMEFADLSEYRELRSNQLQRIKELEQEVIRKRAEYSDTIQQMKTTFLAERAEYTAQSEERIRELTREANKKAVICLDEHSNRIKQENRALRTELMELLKQSKLLNEHKYEQVIKVFILKVVKNLICR